MTETAIKRKRKREEIYEDSLYSSGESPITQLLRFLWRLLTAPVRWSWRQFTRLMSATWRMTKAALRWTLRSCWQVAVWTFHTAKDATVWTIRLPFRAFNSIWQFVFGPPVQFSDPRYAEIYALIARRYRRRSRFITHLFLFIITNTLLWLDWRYTQPNDYFYPFYPFYSTPLLFTMIWTIVLLFHFIRMKHGVEEDRAIEQAIEREREWQALKRREYDHDERHTRLADGDEAVEFQQFTDEAAWEKRKNRN
jgi:hypothetical protein